ncbi:hypothetical protein [Bacillus cereus]|uniref:Uncharacterized protein n=1 Tax=Bacillus cereus TaxID=1396 RepID=A0A2A7HQP7_BACCE|nr:hypothetical protein [Bacillus cereus]PEC18985.1 hypothetical protein COM96_27580 [Bacillus cereus]
MSVWDRPQFTKKSRNLENYGTDISVKDQESIQKNKFDFREDVSRRIVDIKVQEEILSVNVSRYSNVDMVEMKLSSLQALIEFYEKKVEYYKKKYEDADKEVEDIVVSLGESEIENTQLTSELKEKTKRHQAFEDQKTKGISKGRPKVEISDEALEAAYNHMRENATVKDGKRRVSYAKAYRFLQKYYGYEGSDVHLVKSLRKKYSDLPKKKVNPLGLAVQEIMQNEIKKSNAKKSDPNESHEK